MWLKGLITFMCISYEAMLNALPDFTYTIPETVFQYILNSLGLLGALVPFKVIIAILCIEIAIRNLEIIFTMLRVVIRFIKGWL